MSAHFYHTQEKMVNLNIYMGIILQGIFRPIKWLRECEKREPTQQRDTIAGFLHTCDKI